MGKLAAVLLALSTAAMQTSVPKGLEPLQGTWVVTGSGEPMPAGVHVAFVVKGNTYQGITNGTPDERGTFTIGAGSPATLDLVIAEGSSAGKTQLGIIEISGSTVRMSLANPGATARPGVFDGPNTLTLTKVAPLAKDLLGSWEASLDSGGKTLRLALKLANGADGVPTGTFVSLDQGATEIPIAAAVQSGAKVTLIAPTIRATFDGELKAGQLTGTWRQGARSSPMTFARK